MLRAQCIEALGFVVGTQPAVVVIRCGALLAAPWIFFHRGVDSIPWGPLRFRCMEFWEAVLFPWLAPYWGKGLWILHKYLPYPSLTRGELLILLLNKEKSNLCCLQGVWFVYGQEVKHSLINRERKGGSRDQNCGYLAKNDWTKRFENSRKWNLKYTGL